MRELQYLDAGAYEALSPTSATSITAGVRSPTSGEFNNSTALAALITVEDAPIRFTLEGTTPTAGGDGHLMSDGQSMIIEGNAVALFACVDESAASSVKVTTYFKR